MKTIAIHSQKGGVGKTTVALLLGKYAAERGQKVCVLDFDFIGSGIANLVALDEAPDEYVEHYFLSADVQDFSLGPLMGRYTDRGMGGQALSVVLNLGRGLPTGEAARDETELDETMMALVANESHYHEVEMKTGVLLRRLTDEEQVDLTVIDCHPGLGMVSATMARLADVNAYVTTPDRSDCFGLLKAMNLRKLDSLESLLIMNMAVAQVMDLRSFRATMRSDRLVGGDARALFAALKHVGQKGDHFASIPESQELRGALYIGGAVTLPKVDEKNAVFSFCPKLLAFAG